MLKNRETEMSVALSIAGSDSGAGAGIQVDLLTFAAQGVYGTTAITCLTAQNPQGVSDIHVAPAKFVIEQCRQVTKHYHPKAIKTGMLFNSEIVLAVADFLTQSSIPYVVDPVMVASSGATLLSPEAIAAVKNYLIPRATLVTPNLDEASLLLGRKAHGGEKNEAEACELAHCFGVPCLLKGGHALGDELIDTLAWPDGKTLSLKAKRIPEIDTHGSGCTLSAAITAQLALGQDLATATTLAHRYLQEAMKKPIRVAGLKHIRH
ncbi:bifunctional hydroxymethylpyrimidine kinase/phosphomethylpyrimidine kinase [bacterium]|nr:bifunctional hydroxymethylpyrimidine kinase/phosphomethylpyrimidine kinase [bacterium]